MLAYVDELVLQNGRVQDATFERLRAHLSEEAILELTYITALYEMHAIMTRALRLEYDDVPSASSRSPRRATQRPATSWAASGTRA